MAYTTIDKSTDYFNTVLYTGNGTDNHAITGVNFQPDFVWIKPRNEARGHHLQDVIRGVNGALITNETSAEYTGLTNVIKSFDSDGFTLGTSNDVNKSANTHVAWNWLADNTSGSSNTDGSITSTVSANTTSGFSIVSYTGNGTAGATIGHGLGLTPKFIIVKGRDTASNWQVGHSSLGWTQSIRLNQTGASDSRTISWNDTDPTSSVFSVGTDSDCNTNTNDYIAYCFAEKKGFSKFGSYTGNGDSSGNGPFIYTGFKPAWIMIKNASTGSSYWLMVDNKRDTFNVTTKKLYANINNGEFDDTHYNFDFLSNGFKLKSTSTTTNYNNSGDTYIYMCFAESPFTTSTGIPTTAR